MTRFGYLTKNDMHPLKCCIQSRISMISFAFQLIPWYLQVGSKPFAFCILDNPRSDGSISLQVCVHVLLYNSSMLSRLFVVCVFDVRAQSKRSG